MSANRIVTCFCWAPDVSGPAGGDFLSAASNAAPQLPQNRASGRFVAEHERHIFSIFVPHLSQYCPCSALSPQRGQATSISPRGGMATSWGWVVDHMWADPTGLRPGLSPPDASGADRAAWQFANRRGRPLKLIDLLLHATDQGARLVFPVHAFRLAARGGQSEDALGLRPDRCPHLIGERDLGGNVCYHPVRADETDDLRVWRLTGDAGTNPLFGHLRLHPSTSTERSNRSRFTTFSGRLTEPPYVRESGSRRWRRLRRWLGPGRRLRPGILVGIRRPIGIRLVLLSVIR